jgi:hypothetical protein
MQKGLDSEDGLPEWCCSICGQRAASGQRWFALAQNHREDRLIIFHREDLASPHCVRDACSPAHVRELVIHWMVTGNLDYPFAKSAAKLWTAAQSPMPLWEWDGSDPKLAVPIGELAVDRDAVQRILGDNPAGLEAILEELNDALEKSMEEPLDTRMLADLPENLIPHI